MIAFLDTDATVAGMVNNILIMIAFLVTDATVAEMVNTILILISKFFGQLIKEKFSIRSLC
jgi:hypothetical protein